MHAHRMLIGVTGAHGVGKTTFCGHLFTALSQAGRTNVQVLGGLGDRVKAMGLPVGSNATSDSVAAIFAAHLQREREAPYGVVIMDRCLVDALAYVRVLGVTSSAQSKMYEELVRSQVGSLNLLIHLELSETFENTGAPHESYEHRVSVAEAIPSIIHELQLPALSLDAGRHDAISIAVSRINLTTDLARLPSLTKAL